MSIEIPLRNTQGESIELEYTNLPSGSEVLNILKQEIAPLHIWIKLALEYYRQKNYEAFEVILTSAPKIANISYDNFEDDQMKALDLLAAYYVKMGHCEQDSSKKTTFFEKATQNYTIADKINIHDINHLLGRAYFCLIGGDKVEQAETQFNYVLSKDQRCVPALLGKACLLYNAKDYKQSLNFYRKVLRLIPNGPPCIRVGIGHCFTKLENFDRARIAYRRTLDLDPNCVSALIGLALIETNSKTIENVKKGVELLTKAYSLDQNRAMILNHLANHFFYKQDYKKVNSLAIHAFQNTKNESMKAESCYLLAKVHHIQKDYKKSFQYYFQCNQYSSSKFVLPYFGLAQMYLNNHEYNNAIAALERILKTFPDNYETLKMLASLYLKSGKHEKMNLARKYLENITKCHNDDIEAWIEYAQVLENFDPSLSIDTYEKLIKTLTNVMQIEVPVEILNNVGSLHYNLNNFEKSLNYYKKAKMYAETQLDIKKDEYFSSLIHTVNYNIGLACEALNKFNEANNVYKQVLKKCPQYVDCYFRLGSMARDNGQIYNASDWYKTALQYNKDDKEAWSLIGNLHYFKNEWGASQKKFERILLKTDKNDAYSMIALGNIWLQSLQSGNRDRDKDKRHYDRAMQLYTTVLKNDDQNIWAAHGIGCLLAQRRLFNEARDVFSQVREATNEFSDVWINIGHVYFEQQHYMAAIQMYENCLAKFYKYPNIEILMYLARSYMRLNRLKDCLTVLKKARHIQPTSTMIIYNQALVLQRMARNYMEDERSKLIQVEEAILNLNLAMKIFSLLMNHDVQERFEFNMAKIQHQNCSDLLSQTKYQLERSRALDQDRKQKEKIRRQTIQENLDKRIELEKKEQLKMDQKMQENVETRAALIERSKLVASFQKIDENKKKKIINDIFSASSSENENDGKRRKKVKSMKKRKRSKNMPFSGDSSDADEDKEEKLLIFDSDVSKTNETQDVNLAETSKPKSNINTQLGTSESESN
ncbi:RNA polymerase-associated protein CTR9 [Intoshia linei]|uniref:RNA polymerase-associated protein CTR9 n=1 Tax=Intoshia linei TaxID=1819745 RepID=A0A177BDU0_9BILA|nr:RNA polymerase-associated protein CTR9 [Intoshia linei]